MYINIYIIIMSIEYIDVLPSNVDTTQPAGYSMGKPLLQFQIGSQDAMLIGSTVRFNGTFERSGTGNEASAQWEPSLGIYNILDQLHISSNKSSQTIEHIQNYNRFLGSYIPATSSKDDLLGHMNTTSMTTCGELQCLRYAKTNGKFDFSIPLPCGLLFGRNPIPLSDNWGVKGLNINLHLAPDSNVFFSTAVGGDASGSVYQLTNISLTAEIMRPAPDQLSRLMKQTSNSFEYNSISSHYASFNNSYATINKNLGIKRCLSIFVNLVSSSHINNYAENGMACMNVRQDDGSNADITEVIFTRGGIRYPLGYDIVSVQRDYPTSTSGDGQLLRNYLNALSPFSKLDRTTMNALNATNLESLNTSHGSTQPPNVYGVGVAYDTISGQGVDFSSEPFSMVIKSTLNTSNPTSAFIFAHNKASIIMNNQGIQVLE